MERTTKTIKLVDANLVGQTVRIAMLLIVWNVLQALACLRMVPAYVHSNTK